jgi:hypothetical protein
LAKDWKIKPRGTWVLFDFSDVNVIPEQTYYIHKKASHGGLLENSYCWFVAFDNQYSRGEGWTMEYGVYDWKTLWEWVDFDPEFPDPDFCFITYYQEPKYKTFQNPFNSLISLLIEWFPFLESLF